ncbi:MAG: hypothetical protein NDF55_02600 [archaeon GB-1867-005]|nr:hypothetical protein [Candidatus Culexmicrobium cathedralense]
MSLQGESSRQSKFIADGMLGKLARWLRLLGYDVEYCKDLSDEKLVELAKNSCRVLLTKDFELYRRAKFAGVEVLMLRGANLEEDLAQLAAIGLIKIEVDFENTRCPVCNHPLKAISREEFLKITSLSIPSDNDRFWICSHCGKLYWIGKHWKSIKARLLKARRLARHESTKSLEVEFSYY